MSAAPMRAPAPPPVGFSLTLDGGECHDTRMVLKPIAPGYCNQWMQSKSDPRVNRVALCSDYGKGGTDLLIDTVRGPHIFAHDDDEKEDRNPYLGFQLTVNVEASGQRALSVDRVEVVVAKLDPPGGRIEGTLRGTLRDSSNGTLVSVDGTFSVVRMKDRVVD